jgi:hypothetical protein
MFMFVWRSAPYQSTLETRLAQGEGETAPTSPKIDEP